MRALLTGACGFTGRYMAKVLQAAGHDVHAIVQHPGQQHRDAIGTIHIGDLTDAAACQAIVSAAEPDLVVHLAAISFAAHGSVEEMYRINIIGTRNLLDALARAPKSPAATLVASSANIYGNQSDGVLSEQSPVRPANDYGVSKAAMEMLCTTYAKRLPLIVARPFNYTGVGQSKDFLIPKIVEHARTRQPRIRLGNLAVARDFSDVRMIVDAYLRLLHEPRALGGTFQLCAGAAISIRQLLDMVALLSGHAMDVVVDPQLLREGDVMSLCGTPAYIESVIGPLRHLPLQETLGWMLADVH